MTRAVFISTSNIFDNMGNGGSKASREHYNMLTNAVGKENIRVILFLDRLAYENCRSIGGENIYIYEKIEGKIALVAAAVCGCRVYMPWDEKKIIDIISGYNPNLIFLDYSIAGRLIRKLKNYKTVCFYHNVESDYTYNKMKNEGLRFFPAYLAARANDKWGLKSNVVMCFNERDSRRLEKKYGRRADYIFPISLPDRFDESECNTNGSEKKLLFIGSCFGPNEDGIEWFINNVMPELSDGGFELDVVGLGFEKKKQLYSKYNKVKVIGSVVDTNTYYYSHPVVVMPIRFGAGMKVKTAEALMYGRYIAASDEALEGYEIEGTDDIKKCNTKEEYIEAILYFYERQMEKYSKTNRKLYLENFESSRLQNHFVTAINQIISGEGSV